jgi:hypothetical protein
MCARRAGARECACPVAMMWHLCIRSSVGCISGTTSAREIGGPDSGSQRQGRQTRGGPLHSACSHDDP